MTETCKSACAVSLPLLLQWNREVSAWAISKSYFVSQDLEENVLAPFTWTVLHISVKDFFPFLYRKTYWTHHIERSPTYDECPALILLQLSM